MILLRAKKRQIVTNFFLISFSFFFFSKQSEKISCLSVHKFGRWLVVWIDSKIFRCSDDLAMFEILKQFSFYASAQRAWSNKKTTTFLERNKNQGNVINATEMLWIGWKRKKSLNCLLFVLYPHPTRFYGSYRFQGVFFKKKKELEKWLKRKEKSFFFSFFLNRYNAGLFIHL